MRIETAEVLELAHRAVIAAGGSDEMAHSLARAVVAAVWAGNPAVGPSSA